MKYSRLLLLFILSLFCLAADAQWTQLTVPNATASFRTAYFKNTNEGFVAGGERIRRTANGGTTWDTVSYGNLWAYLSLGVVENIHFISPAEGIACGWNFSDNCEIIFKTFDGGATWSTITWGNPQAAFGTYLYDMAFLNSTKGYCVGEQGHILSTNDGGNTWSYITSGTANDLHGIYFVGNTGWIVGSETILKSTNQGSTWTSQSFPGKYFQDVYFTSANVGYAVGSHIYKTTDGGTSWSLIGNPYTLNCKSVWATNSDTIYIANSGNLLKSNNAGSTWFPQYTAPLGKNYECVWFLNSTFGLAGTGDGKVYKTIAGGDPVQANDAGVSSIATPVNACPGLNPVSVQLKNFGQSNLTAATINWKVNGALQTPYSWTGNLPFNVSSGPITLGTATLNAGSNTIVAYTTSANGMPEIIHTNDTAAISPNFTRLSGTYTIGGTNPNYATISDAVTQLTNNGTCGDVTFKIRNGTYSSAVTLGTWFRTNTNDHVVFESESGDSTQVILNGNNTKFMLTNGCSNITFRKMTLTSLDDYTIIMENLVKNITISNCVISTYSAGKCIHHYGNPADGIVISNNLFTTGDDGIEFSGNYINPSNNVTITGNSFNGQLKSPISVKTINNLLIDKNTISTTAAPGACISIDACNGGFTVSNNKMLANYGTVLGISNCTNILGAEGKIINNYFASSVPSVNGISIFNSYHLNFYYNSINVQCTSAVRLLYDDTIKSPNIEFINNAVVNRKAAYVFEIENVDGTADPSWYSRIFKNISHNSYVNNTLNSGGVYYFGTLENYGNVSDFAEWKQIFTTESTSVNADAQFTSFTDYHIYPNTNNYKLNNAGIPVSSITTDLDGNLRSATTPDIGADEYTGLTLDAGGLRLDKTSLICPGVNSLSLRIINCGTSTLTSATLNLSVNGIVQSPTSWNGTLAIGDSSSFLLLSNYNFILGNTYSIKAWTSNPNGGTDGLAANDTVAVTLVAGGMSGTYTIGGTNPSYATIANAVTDLNTIGVCSPVVFNIRPGSYNEAVVIASIPGVSLVNNVVFKSETGDSTSVIIYHTTGPCITFDSTSYVTLHQLGFGNGTNRGTLHLKNNSHHISFTNNSWDNANGYPAITNDIKNSSYLLVDRNHFNRCLGGVVFSNVSYPVYSRANVFTNNIFTGPRASAFFISRPHDLIIANNTITNSYTTSNLPQMINIEGGIGKLSILNNRIYMRNCLVGISLTSCTGRFYDESIIANNMVSIRGNHSTACFITGNSRFLKVIHNTGVIDSAVALNTEVIYVGDDVDVYNNCFYNKTGGYVMYRQFPLEMKNSDYNNLYTTGPYFFNAAIYPNNLTTWQMTTGNDIHSLNVVPSLVDPLSDLHLNNDYFLDAAGIPIADVTTDIDGNARNASTPDIGADEVGYPPIANDAGVRSVVIQQWECPGITPVEVTLKNFGTNMLTSATIHWSVNGVVQPTFAWTGTLTSMAVSPAIQVGNYNFQAPDSFDIIAWTSTPNGIADIQGLNDSAKFMDYHTRLNGAYTIGGTNPDYLDITKAVAALNNYGICGPVTFNVRSGTYNQTFNPGVAVSGVSATNTITLQSEMFDSSQVILGALLLTGLDYVTVKSVTLASVSLTTQSDYTIISNCIITNDVVISNSNHVLIETNVMNGQLSLSGTFSVPAYDNTVRNNTLFNDNGIVCNYQDSLLIEKNVIINLNTTLTSGSRGISVSSSSPGSFKLLKNRVNGNFGRGIVIEQSGFAGNPNLIANNIVAAGNLGDYNFYLSAEFAKVIHNTAFAPAGSSSMTVIIANTFNDDGLIVKNNQFINYGNDFACYWAQLNSNTLTVSDYNNFYSNGPTLIRVGTSTNFTTIAAFATAHPGFDDNSTDVDPQFPSSSNLFPVNPLAQATGTPIPEVTDDIDGNPRNSITPTMGAYEIPCPQSFATIAASACGSYTSQSGNQTWTSSGTYTDTISNAIGCDSILTINLTILPLPAITVVASGLTTFCAGDSVILSANAGLTGYQWYRWANLIPGATSKDYTAKSKGLYKCLASDANLCTGTSNSIKVSVPCIQVGPNHQRANLSGAAPAFQIYPNPGTGLFFVESPPGLIEIFNAVGELVLSGQIVEETSKLDLSPFPDGIYIIKIRTTVDVYSGKIVLNR